MPNVFTYNALIRALSTGGEPQQALNVFIDLLATDISPNHITCCEVISASLLLGRRRESLAFFGGRRSQEYATVFPRPRTAHQALIPNGPRVLVNIIDLHGLSPATARIAIIDWLRELQASPASAELDVVIVTGQGNGSRVAGQSAVKEAVLELLTSELNLRLSCVVPAHNPGRIHVSASEWAAFLKTVDIEAWLQDRRISPLRRL